MRLGKFIGAGGLSLFYRSHLPEDPLGHVVVVHGALEHSGRYQDLWQWCQEAGYGIHLFDLPGHGKSEGIRGDANHVDDFVLSLASFLEYLDVTYKVRNPILLGHSMGGLIALRYGVKPVAIEKLAGVVVSAPALSIHKGLGQFLKELLARKFLMKFAPALRLDPGISPRNLSHCQSRVQGYVDDPLIGNKMSVRLALNIIDSGEEALSFVRDWKLPILLLHGEEDRVTNLKGTSNFFDRLDQVDKKLIVYPDFFHELFNETEDRRQMLKQDLMPWLASHLA